MKKYIVSVVASTLPTLALAQSVNVTSLNTAANAIITILNIVFPVLLAIAVFIIVWGIFKFILNAGDEEARKTGRGFILWGVVGVFLMLSVWGLVNILQNTISLNNQAIVANNLFSNVTP